MSIYGSEYGVDIEAPLSGGTPVTSLPVDNTMGLNDPLYDDTGRTVGNQTLYSTTADNFNNVASVDPSIIDKLSGYAKNLYTTNGAVDFRKIATLLGGGIAAFNANPGNKGGSGAGYQGGIPTLYAGRNMLTAPPAMVGGKPRRAGSGGINYGGDVTYFNTKAEVDALKAAEAERAALVAATVATPNTAVTTPATTVVNPATLTPTYPGSTVPLNSTGLTPQIANYLMYKGVTVGGNTSDFDKYGGYAAVKTVAKANGFDATPEWIANYEKTAGLTPSQATIDNPPGSYPASPSTTSTNTTATKQVVTDNAGEPAAKRQVVGSTPILPGEVHMGGGIFRTRDGDMVNSQGQKVGLAEGGIATGRYLQGGTDGMADKLPARIGADKPAALSHGEFVIPADVVSHMGNGNSDAGAKKLYQMMDKIRMARTGNKKQGKKINPDKFMPGGLAAAYAAGGTVKHFEAGGPTTSSLVNAGFTGTESNLSNWAGPYVTGMLGQGQALANMPYQAYTGDLTAGTSPLLSSAFTNASALSTPSSISNAATTAGSIATKAKDLAAYKPTTSSFDSTKLTSYMNPYLDKILTPQLDAARRQSEITKQQNAGQMTRAGAYGGGRQAIMDTETQRTLADTQANITGKGYDTAYQNALSQFNADQQRKMQEGQFGASYGLQGLNTGLQAAQAQGSLGVQQNQVGLANLAQQLAAGTAQRGIESEGIAADRAQFEEARANPYKMVQFQQSLLQGLPLASQAYNTGSESALVAAAKGAKTVNELLKNLGINVPA